MDFQMVLPLPTPSRPRHCSRSSRSSRTLRYRRQ
uniref:Uncharacterized protein n=1 Tax=Anguilla anguilla TaxID=7936 RepID=A0A0E9SJW0_ANGAN